MAPPRRPGLTILSQKALVEDAAVVLIWTAVPVEHYTAAMLAFRAGAEVVRVLNDAEFGLEELSRSDHPANPTMQHWQVSSAVSV